MTKGVTYGDLSSKVITLSQYHCSSCHGTKLITIFPLRIPPTSYQASSSKKRDAFKRAVAHDLSTRGITNYGDCSLCVYIVFVIGKVWDSKDIDNLPKLLLDVLQGPIYKNDNQIVHLNMMKFRWEGEEDFIFVNIRESDMNQHDNVLYKKMAHDWAGLPALLR